MKTQISGRLAMAVLSFVILASQTPAAFAQGTAFTYQGQLNNGVSPANGTYDLRFGIYDAVVAGTQQGTLLTNSTTIVSNGVFTVTLDFGSQFPGANRWLEIGVRTNGGGAFTTLSPRQALKPTPYAITAATATTTATNSVSSASIVDGSIVNADIATGAAIADSKLATISTSGKVANSATTANSSAAPNSIVARDASGAFSASSISSSFTGNGVGLVSLNASELVIGTVPDARLAGNVARTNQVWLLAGNAGTVAGVNFLGTTDNQPLELKANNIRALRLEPTGSTPNIIGGGSANSTTLGTIAGTIGGGNGNAILSPAFTTIGGGATNTIRSLSDYSTVGGGAANSINSSADKSTIGGGLGNTISDRTGIIAGGERNFIDWGDHATITGGLSNRIGYYATGTASFAVIGGGWENFVLNGLAVVGGGRANRCGVNLSSFLDGYASTIAGGVSNVANGTYGSIGGGSANLIQTNTTLAVVAGGQFNLVQTNASASTIGGGLNNLNAGTNSVVGGGYANTNYSDASVIAGGKLNSILDGDVQPIPKVGGYGSSIGGGVANAIKSGVFFSDGSLGRFNNISGGASNSIGGVNGIAIGDTIGGGTGNNIAWSTIAATIAGGSGNGLAEKAYYSTISGGSGNLIDALDGTIAGGSGNKIQCYLFNGQTIGGGTYNTIGTGLSDCNHATISGGQSNRVENAAQLAIIPGGDSAKAINYGQLTHASGPFAAPGDAQTSVYVCRNTTTSAAQTELFLDGVSRRMSIPANSTWSVDVLITARTASGSSAGYRVLACIENQAGVTALVGSPVVTAFEDAAAWDATLAADDTNDALVIRVTGAAGTTIRWVASVRVAEVNF